VNNIVFQAIVLGRCHIGGTDRLLPRIHRPGRAAQARGVLGLAFFCWKDAASFLLLASIDYPCPIQTNEGKIPRTINAGASKYVGTKA